MLNKLLPALIAVVALGFTFNDSIASGCKSCPGCDDKKTVKKASALCQACGQEVCVCPAHDHHSMGTEEGATSHPVYTAEYLYTCPMHVEVVTDNAELKCPLCKMKLSKMSDEQVKLLKDSSPKNCSICPIVVKGDSETHKCPTCKMKLVDIEKIESSKDKLKQGT